MDIVQLLLREVPTIAFLRMIILLPELTLIIAAVFTACQFKYFLHPYPPAFCFTVYGLLDIYTGCTFDLAKNMA